MRATKRQRAWYGVDFRVDNLLAVTKAEMLLYLSRWSPSWVLCIPPPLPPVHWAAVWASPRLDPSVLIVLLYSRRPIAVQRASSSSSFTIRPGKLLSLPHCCCSTPSPAQRRVEVLRRSVGAEPLRARISPEPCRLGLTTSRCINLACRRSSGSLAGVMLLSAATVPERAY